MGLEEYASIEEVRKAYRQLSLKYHPDRCKDKDKLKCKEKFQQITQAYEILMDYCVSYRISFMEKDIEENPAEDNLYKRFYEDWFL